SCDVPHLFEVTGMSDVSADFPAKVPPPTPDQWRQLSVTKCGPTAATYLGGKLDPMGKFAVNALQPREEQWSTGDRKLRCGLQRATVTGSAQPLTGSAAKQDQ